MSLRRSSRYKSAPGANEASSLTNNNAGSAELPSRFVCHHCNKHCKTEHYLRQHQQHSALCGLLSAANLHEESHPYPPLLVATAISHVPPSTMNNGTSVTNNHQVIGSQPRSASCPTNLPSDLEISLDHLLFDDTNSRLSEESDHLLDNMDEFLGNAPQAPVPPYEEHHNSRTAPPPLLDVHHDDSYPDYDPFIDNDESLSLDSHSKSIDISHLPAIPEPHGRCQPLDNSMPISPVKDITNSLNQQKSLEGISCVQDRMMLKLILMLDSFRAPHYSFQKILEWVDECITSCFLDKGRHGYKFSPMKRQTFMKQLEKLFPTVPRPVQSVVPIEDSLTYQFHSGLRPNPVTPSGTTTQQLIDEYRRSSRSTAIVPSFDARQQIISLLSDTSLFGNPNNLHVNLTGRPDDMFLPYRTAPGMPISDIHSGSWYQRSVRAPDFDSRREFMIPLIGYIDATGTDAYSRYKLEPFLISFSIFKPNVLGKAQSWRLLGMVPDLELDSSARKTRQRSSKNNEGKSMHCRNYHNMLQFTLSSLIELQRTGLEYNLRIGNFEKHVRIRFPLAFISGDGKSNNMLSGRYTSHQSQVLRQCRACLVHREELVNTVNDCFKIPQEIPWFLVQHLHNLVEKESLDEVGSPNAESTERPTHVTTECGDSPNTPIAQGISDDTSSNESSANDEESVCSSNEDVHSNDQSTQNSDSQSETSKASSRSGHAEVPFAYSELIEKFRDLMSERKKLLSVTSRQKQSMNQQEREHLTEKKNHIRDLLYTQCCSMIQHVVGHKPLNSLSVKHWIRVRKSIWQWVNCFSAAETKEVLRVISQYESRLATHELDYGTDRYGVNMCTPTDLMHAFLLGVVRYACQSMMDLWPPRLKAAIDNLVDTNLRSQMQQERVHFPRADFSKGVTNLTQLTAQEWIGLCFTLYLVLISGDGRHAVDTILPNNDVDDSIDCLAKMLSFVAYYKYGTYWHSQDIDKQRELLQSIQQMSADIQRALPRKEGVGWYLSKLHEIQHTPMDIDRYGCPAGYDACTGERLLKFMAKLPAATSQRQNYSNFMMQVCQRLYHGQLLHVAKSKWLDDNEDDDVEASEHRHCLQIISKSYTDRQAVSNRFHPTIKNWESTMSIGRSPTNGDQHGSPTYAVVNERSLETGRSGMKPNIPHMVLKSIYKYVSETVISENTLDDSLTVHTVVITGYSEGMIYRMKNGKEIHRDELNLVSEEDAVCFRIRCHPSYRSGRPWHDWVVLLSGDESEQLSSVPCKILSMFTWTYAAASIDASNVCAQKYMAVVWSLSANDSAGEVLAERRVRMFASVEDDPGASVPVLSIVDVNSIATNRVLVIEDVPQLQEMYHSLLHDRRIPHYCSVVADMRRDWASEFTGASSTYEDYQNVIKRRQQRQLERTQRRHDGVNQHVTQNSSNAPMHCPQKTNWVEQRQQEKGHYHPPPQHS